MIVIDTNIIGYLFLTGNQSALAETVLRKDGDWVAPPLWRSELRNVLTSYMRQQWLSLSEAMQIMEVATEFMSGNEFEVKNSRVLELANQSGCSAYDCEFVALADELDLMLVTADKKILGAFPQIALSPASFCSDAAPARNMEQ